MRSSYSTVCDQMPMSLEALGGDVLLEVVSWLSRVDLLNLVMTVRPSSTLAPAFCFSRPWSFSDNFAHL